MPYLLMRCKMHNIQPWSKLRIDDNKDARTPELMKELNAIFRSTTLNGPDEYYLISDTPSVVLNKLEGSGYRVISSSGTADTIVWTLYSP